MATTVVFSVNCPHCGYEGDVELADLDQDPKCAECDESLGKVYRIEGGRLIKPQDA